MRKALRIVAVSAGIVSVVSAVILGCIYLEDVVEYTQKVKMRITNKIKNQKYIGEEYDHE